ncbi:MAG TPA: glutamine--fructose-6-phosphate transaminase (isomerizing) [Thermoanaerobaculia bacterium]|jgi:glucosamine--fructose-6-phosphate aminotransferase (isomerizing)|nr:glutamine--fructose-6-phosphate transaminase (isomerizing) [Thermoanaerobaculia bacterium]
MCGIVGYVGQREVVPLLMEGLHRLEYRGYDSAGVVAVDGGKLRTLKAEGKLERLREKLTQHPLSGHYGLGHTRWATHGPPSERNAHPMIDSRHRVALIHNGIIENFLALKKRLLAQGWTFSSDTDTEVVANLISSYLDDGRNLRDAVASARAELEGMYAFAVVAARDEGDERDERHERHESNERDDQDAQEIVAARMGPPLVIGLAKGEQYLSSDPTALLAYTRDVIFLENGDLASLRPGGVRIWDRAGQPVERPVQHLNWDPVQAEKGGFKHFMLKEIHDQTQAVQDTLGTRVDFERGRILLDNVKLPASELRRIDRLHLLACGTSWHAALVGKFMIEQIARLPVEVDYGSEYRYRDPIVDDRVLAVGISQSGETADTVSAMEAARERGAHLFCVCNVQGSQATRISDGVIYTHAGPEIGVASTKAFTTQLVALYLLALYLRQERQGDSDASKGGNGGGAGDGGAGSAMRAINALAHLPHAVDEVLRLQAAPMEELARRYFRADSFLYLGRGINYPIALEGALKLKEISYIHAEGYPAGEMKHGPIALIDESMPVVALATGDQVFEKVKSNLQEVKARDGVVIAVTDRDPEELGGVCDEVITVPSVAPLLQPVVNVIPLQLLAYYIGVRRGCDVDQPRNLAKSVTVE